MQPLTIDERLAQLLEDEAGEDRSSEQVYQRALHKLVYEGVLGSFEKENARGVAILRWVLDHRALIPDSRRSHFVAEALTGLARAFAQRGDHTRALAYHARIFELAGIDPPAAPDGNITDALFEYLEFLFRHERYDEAVTVVDRIDAWPRDLSSDEDERLLVHLLMWKGRALLELDRPTEAAAWWESLVARYESMPESREELRDRLHDLAECFQDQQQPVASMRTLRFCLAHFPLSAEDSRAPDVAKLLDALGWDMGYPLEGLPAPEAVEAFESLYRLFHDAPSEELRHQALEARCRQFDVLKSLERNADALTCAETLNTIPLEGLPDPLLKALAETAFEQADLFWELGESKAALAALAAFDQRWKAVPSAEVRKSVARGLFRQVTAHLFSQEWRKACALIRLAADRYSEMPREAGDLPLTTGIAGQPRMPKERLVLHACLEMQSLVSRMGRRDSDPPIDLGWALVPPTSPETRAAHRAQLEQGEQLLQTFSAMASSRDTDFAVAWCLYRTGVLRFRLGEEAGALERLRAVVRRFGRSVDPLIAPTVVDATFLVGMVQVCAMKRRWLLEGPRVGRESCVELKRTLEADRDFQAERPLCRLVTGYLSYLAGELEPAIEALGQAMVVPKQVRPLADTFAKQYPLPRDAAFVQLLTPGA